MKRNKMFVVGVLAAAFLLIPTGLQAQGDHCPGGQRKNCLLGSFSEVVTVPGFGTFKALVTFSPGGGVVETNNAQGQPVTVHGSWAPSKEDHDQFDLTFITLGLQPMNWSTVPPTPLGPGGSAKTKETVTLSDSGDSFTAVFQVQEMTPTGVVFATVNGTATGTRILVEPLGN
jgi:hypothetical protein